MKQDDGITHDSDNKSNDVNVDTTLPVVVRKRKKKHKKDKSRLRKAQKSVASVEVPTATTSEFEKNVSTSSLKTKSPSSKKSLKHSKKRMETNTAIDSNPNDFESLLLPGVRKDSKKRKETNVVIDLNPRHGKVRKSGPINQNLELTGFEKLVLPANNSLIFESRSKAVNQVDNNSTFYDKEIAGPLMLDIKYMATYIRNVSDARKESQKAELNENASKSPIWNHEDYDALKKLHGIQSLNIWLIDYCIATRTAICRDHDYMKMLAIYVGELPMYFF